MQQQAIRITPRNFAPLFWGQLFKNLSQTFTEDWALLQQYFNDNEQYRAQADYNTGSINLSSAVCLLGVARMFQPQMIAEVGTFIGNSAMAMALGVAPFNNNATLHTCDMSNNINLQWPFSHIELQQYQGQSSEAMFSVLKQQQTPIDLLYLDGRISDAELNMLLDMLNRDGVVVFDDFEGVEKGVVNAMKFKQHKAFNQHILICPPSNDDFKVLPLNMQLTNHMTAVLLPISQLCFAPQG